jgi:hypothetical protein
MFGVKGLMCPWKLFGPRAGGKLVCSIRARAERFVLRVQPVACSTTARGSSTAIPRNRPGLLLGLLNDRTRI